jgi:hypothetical protein
MPRIKLTPTVKIALWMFRIYLLVLITATAKPVASACLDEALAKSGDATLPAANHGESSNHLLIKVFYAQLGRCRAQMVV